MSSGSPNTWTSPAAIAVAQSRRPRAIGSSRSASASTYTYRSSESFGSSRQTDGATFGSRSSQTLFLRVDHQREHHLQLGQQSWVGAAGRLEQDLVAGEMAHRVVDRLEVVDVWPS
jgi:hypothetical protein